METDFLMQRFLSHEDFHKTEKTLFVQCDEDKWVEINKLSIFVQREVRKVLSSNKSFEKKLVRLSLRFGAVVRCEFSILRGGIKKIETLITSNPRNHGEIAVFYKNSDVSHKKVVVYQSGSTLQRFRSKKRNKGKVLDTTILKNDGSIIKGLDISQDGLGGTARIERIIR